MARDLAHADAAGSPATAPGVDPEAGSGDWLDEVDEVDPWAWIEEEHPEDDGVDISRCHVTGVLVALDAARWLPDTLAGLAALHHRPTRLIAIDNDSSDTTMVLLQRALDTGLLDAVYSTPSVCGFGEAVESALTQDRAAQDRAAQHRVAQDRAAQGRETQHRAAQERATQEPAGQTRRTGQRPGSGAHALQPADSTPAEQLTTEWLWLLHDDATPGPHALERLLAHVVTDPSIDVTGPKLLLPKRRHSAVRISEIGVSISGTGRREVLLDTGEIDQGQRDEPRRRLGVSTCGMLVRRSVWDALDGLDPDLPVFRDGVDFGWRAHLAGYSVVTTPHAEFTHRQVGRAGLRTGGVAGSRPARLDRYLGMLVVVGHAPTARLPLVWLRLVWGCLLHALGYLFGKVPGRSVDELAALGSFLAHPGRIRALRRRLASGRRVPGADEIVRPLRPRWWSGLRVGAEAISGAVSERYRSVAGELEVATIDELTGDDFSTATDEQPKNPWLSPVVIVTVLSVLASLVAARQLLGIGSLVGPALLPAQSHLGDLWRAVWQPVPGAPSQSSPPWLALTAIGSTVLAGRAEWFVTVALLAVVPISLVTAYPVARLAVRGRRVRLWVALTYALLPVLLGGTNQGRLSLGIFAIALPLLVLSARALVLRRPRAPEAWRGGWGSGVVLVALVAFEPSMMIFALAAGVAGALALRRTPRKVGRIGIAVGVPLLLLASWWPSVVSDWGRLFTGPDSALGGTPPAARVWQLLLGREVGPGLPPLWVGAIVFGVIWVVALVGLARRPRSRSVRAAWVAALLALTMAVLVSRLVVSVPPAGAEVRPWVGVYLLIAFGALVLAGGIGADGLSADLGARSFSWLQPGVVLAGLLVGLVTVLGAGWWVWAGATGPVQRERLDGLPPYVVNAMQSDRQVRVLALDLTGSTARVSVIADDQIRLGDADRGYTFGGSTAAPAQVQDLVMRLVAGTADSDITPQLGNLGIGYLWTTGASEEQQARIANTSGLGAASGTARGTVWQLEPEVSRASLTSDGQRIPITPGRTVIPPGPDGRVLRLGEATDPRWRATLDRVQLRQVPDGWQQAYAVPSSGGTLEYGLVSYTHWFLFAQGALLLVAGVLAAPGIRRPEVRDPTRTARRAATLGGVAR